MAKSPKEPESGAPKSEAELRAERRAAALRANLHRRKAQTRQRADGPADTRGESGSGDS
ncbi:hypothetical protein NUH88_06605 [Nisaea acidiphila]|uniref:Uncharacterized protein n=1 Tax=Nisaea acidiphila TaxID=1862145 RepID=A0A9J7AVL2_9PROT|nr:hypothetical protein [Nisaea acidiphila]UUX51360.1 hypothetical protein NUH88_06605 [Nisaea acidiphila]